MSTHATRDTRSPRSREGATGIRRFSGEPQCHEVPPPREQLGDVGTGCVGGHSRTWKCESAEASGGMGGGAAGCDRRREEEPKSFKKKKTARLDPCSCVAAAAGLGCTAPGRSWAGWVRSSLHRTIAAMEARYRLVQARCPSLCNIRMTCCRMDTACTVRQAAHAQSLTCDHEGDSDRSTRRLGFD